MSQGKLNSDDQNGEQSENQIGCSRSRSTLIACVVCDRVFFDNISLVLHFESHLKGEVSIPTQQERDLAPLQSSSPSSYPSSMGIKTEAHHLEIPRMNTPCPLPVSSATTPNPTPNPTPRAASLHIPTVNAMSLVNPLQPMHRSMMSTYGPTSSSSSRMMFSQSGARSFAHGPRAAPHFQMQNAGQARFSNYRNSRTNQSERPIPQLIVISDDEEDDKKKAEEIDLTLKL